MGAAPPPARVGVIDIFDTNYHMEQFGSYPHISIGWDNNPRFIGFMGGITKNNGPEEFEKGLRKAKEYVDTHNLPVPLITINS